MIDKVFFCLFFLVIVGIWIAVGRNLRVRP